MELGERVVADEGTDRFWDEGLDFVSLGEGKGKISGEALGGGVVVDEGTENSGDDEEIFDGGKRGGGVCFWSRSESSCS